MWMSADKFTRGLKRCFHSHTYLKYVQKVNPEVFSISKRGKFFQEQPILSNPFDWDKFLQRCMQRLLPNNVSVASKITWTTMRSRAFIHVFIF